MPGKRQVSCRVSTTNTFFWTKPGGLKVGKHRIEWCRFQSCKTELESQSRNTSAKPDCWKAKRSKGLEAIPFVSKRRSFKDIGKSGKNSRPAAPFKAHHPFSKAKVLNKMVPGLMERTSWRLGGRTLKMICASVGLQRRFQRLPGERDVLRGLWY